MDLETLLLAVQSLHDLPKLVAALGHQPLWEEVPNEFPGRGTHPPPKITVVGRTGELPWFAIASPAPRRDAEKLARRMSLRGRVCLVLALEAAGRRLALSVGFDGFPGLALDLARPSPEALASLVRLAGKGEGGSLAFAARAADALAAESVGRRFFREFRATLDRVAAGLPGPMRAADRHNLALLQLTRILFLYFIQTKGWLGGEERFLANQVDRCLGRGRRIHRDLLRPLFFGTLNRPKAVRSRTAAAFGAIPFLNGGLFEPHLLERRFRADVPNEVWRDAFDRLFERFHFTVTERDRHGGVAPDMLGRVFEGAMAPEARRASGTFYTPAALVRTLMDGALIALLARRLDCGESQAERRLHDPDIASSRVLASLTLLDPAVGSGAFLLGALDRLCGARHDPNPSVRKRLVLQQNLFGVDQSAAAVRLTELRLWLAVIADDPADHADHVEPLPNLDCLVRQGDSLFDPMGHNLPWPHPPALVAELAELRQAVVTASGSSKRTLVRRLQVVEARVLGQSLDSAEEQTSAEVSDCLGQARGSDLFGQRRGLSREQRNRLGLLRQRLHTLRQARRRLIRDGEVPWFHYQSHFADVFDKGGFDLVIGNPPWLRSEEIPPETRGRLAGRYRWWRTGSSGYGNRPDLAIAFLERALELASPGAVVAMLVPAKIASARYGAAARHAIATTTTLHTLADLTEEAGAEFDATVYPMALIASKSPPAPGRRVRTALGPTSGNGVRQSRLAGGGPWLLVGEPVQRVLLTLQTEFPRLGERFVCHLGLKTGANRIFLNPPDDLEPEVLRWAIRGRDLAPFCCVPRSRLLWTHDAEGKPRRELPSRCMAYLAPYHSELRARRDFTGGPPWTLFRAAPAVARHRVVWADLARQLAAAALTTHCHHDCIPLNSCYVAVASSATQAEHLAAWLNSTWLRAAARAGTVRAAGGFARFNAQAIADLPLPDPGLADPELGRLARAGRLGAAVQDELDDLVGRHLNLSSVAQSALRAVVGGSSSNRR